MNEEPEFTYTEVLELLKKVTGTSEIGYFEHEIYKLRLKKKFEKEDKNLKKRLVTWIKTMQSCK